MMFFWRSQNRTALKGDVSTKISWPSSLMKGSFFPFFSQRTPAVLVVPLVFHQTIFLIFFVGTSSLRNHDLPNLIVSTMVSVKKSDPKWLWFILDCSPLNSQTEPPPPFRLPNHSQIILSVLSCDFAFIADFTSWFFQHEISEAISAYFAFRKGSKPYLLRRLAQGWKFSPIIAQTSSEILGSTSNDPGLMWTFAWIDNLIFFDKSFHTLSDRRLQFLSQCSRANAILGELSSTCDYVGMELDLKLKRWRVKPSWASKAATFVSDFTDCHSLLASDLWALSGLVLWYLRVSLLPILLV